ncbi:MAG: hypothetical protein DUD27_04220 [Lachnospiraceae bacterium]|uniref:BIG2 domain-containing protein n=1 Tax=Candidatus Weimeria bifida TaxID=2599074 RepID=A0A6N7J2G7_9FIRM|nr:hypothetical protein [Candidatus Weimeria bifida]RRF96550.1 MAG: hypothetical protein DUD27_04220 [Lachnospiraceae bacterium]
MKPIRIFTVLLSSAMLLTAVPAVTARADEPSQTSASGDVPVEPQVDYSKITLEKTSFTFLASNSYLGYDSVNGSTVLKGVPDGVSLDDIDLDYSNTGKKISVYDVYIENNKLCFEASGTGTTTVNVTIGTKKLSFKLTIMGLSLSKRSYMLVKGKSTTVKLKLSGSKSKKGIKITYKSLSPKIASVSKTGKVKAKKTGTAVIKVTAKYGKTTCRYGTAVNVTTPLRYAVYKWDRNYSNKNRYSQKNRMKKGYYDCSSLVWRAYRSRGIRMLYKKYAPTAAGLAEYLVKKHKKVASASYKNFQARKFQVGDLLFETGANNRRYKGIYHVEMFAGYTFDSFNSKGKPVLGLNFANKATGGDDNAYYGVSQKNFLCRP